MGHSWIFSDAHIHLKESFSLTMSFPIILPSLYSCGGRWGAIVYCHLLFYDYGEDDQPGSFPNSATAVSLKKGRVLVSTVLVQGGKRIIPWVLRSLSCLPCFLYLSVLWLLFVVLPGYSVVLSRRHRVECVYFILPHTRSVICIKFLNHSYFNMAIVLCSSIA